MESEDLFSLHHNRGSSLTNHSTNCDESSMFYTPWSTYPYEIKATASTHKVQTERSEYGSEADLYGLVSNILDEPNKAQSFVDGEFCSPILKSEWPCNINKLSDHRNLFPDLRQSEEVISLPQSLYGPAHALNTETQKAENLYHGLNDLDKDEHCLYEKTDSSQNFDVNAKINPLRYFNPNSFFLSELPNDLIQKRDTIVSPLNRYNLKEEDNSYDMSNHSKAMHNKHTMTGFQNVKSHINLASELPFLDAHTYSNFFPAKKNCQTFDNLIPDQMITIPKATRLVSYRPFLKQSIYVPEYDYGCNLGGNMTFTDHFQKPTPKQELQNPDFIKSSSLMSSICSNNFNKLLWTNGQMKRSSQNLYNNEVRPNNPLMMPQKNPATVSHYSNSYSPPIPGGSVHMFSNEIRSYPFLDHGYSSADKTLEEFDKTTEESNFESEAEKSLKTLNGIRENASSVYSSSERNVKKTISEKKQNVSFCVQNKNKGYFGSAPRYSNLMNMSVDNRSLNSSTLTLPQNINLSNGLLMSDMGSNVSSSSKFRLPLFNDFGHINYPVNDSHDPYSYENQSQVWPQICDLMDPSLPGSGAMLSTQRSMKTRNLPGSELHLCLDNCYEQYRTLKKERKKADALLMKYFPGMKDSCISNPSFPRLTANPSRVDRLIVDQLREQTRVVALLNKMEHFRSSPLHANIFTTLDHYLECIDNVQTERKSEIMNTSGHHQKHCRPRHNDKDILFLASLIRKMALATRKARTALWCALQMTLPKSLHAQSTGVLEN